MENQEQKPGLWEGVEVLSTYSRAQALEDGVLVDVTSLAREAGFRLPVAVTVGVWAVLEPSEALKAEGQDLVGRAWDLFTILREAIRRAGQTDTVHFAPLFIREPERPPVPVEMYARCGPGDECEPVITVLLRGED